MMRRGCCIAALLTLLISLMGAGDARHVDAHPYDSTNHGGILYPSFFGQYIANSLGVKMTINIPPMPAWTSCQVAASEFLSCYPNADANVLPVQQGISYPTTANSDFHAIGVFLGCGQICSGVGPTGRAYKRAFMDGRCNGVYYANSLSQTFVSGEVATFDVRRVGSSSWNRYINGTLRGAKTCAGGQYGISAVGHELAYGDGAPATPLTLSYPYIGSAWYRRDQSNVEYLVSEVVNVSPHEPGCGVYFSFGGYGPIVSDHGSC